MKTPPRHLPVVERPHNLGGVCRLYRFTNGYGASVVRFLMPLSSDYGSYTSSEQEWEVAVIIPRDGKMNKFDLTYNTPITNDVIGHVHDSELDDLLDRIAALPATKGSQ